MLSRSNHSPNYKHALHWISIIFFYGKDRERERERDRQTDRKELLVVVYHGDLIRWRMAEQPLSLSLPLSSFSHSSKMKRVSIWEPRLSTSPSIPCSSLTHVCVRYCFAVDSCWLHLVEMPMSHDHPHYISRERDRERERERHHLELTYNSTRLWLLKI